MTVTYSEMVQEKICIYVSMDGWMLSICGDLSIFREGERERKQIQQTVDG